MARAVLALVLYALLRGKASKEEKALEKIHVNYGMYKNEVPCMLFPFMED